MIDLITLKVYIYNKKNTDLTGTDPTALKELNTN